MRQVFSLARALALAIALVLALAAVAVAATRPTPKQLAGLLDTHGATAAKCVTVGPYYGCAYEYRGQCVIAEFRVIAQDWQKPQAWQNRVFNAYAGRCRTHATSSAPQS